MTTDIHRTHLRYRDRDQSIEPNSRHRKDYGTTEKPESVREKQQPNTVSLVVIQLEPSTPLELMGDSHDDEGKKIDGGVPYL
jgi:hypothetical protein